MNRQRKLHTAALLANKPKYTWRDEFLQLASSVASMLAAVSTLDVNKLFFLVLNRLWNVSPPAGAAVDVLPGCLMCLCSPVDFTHFGLMLSAAAPKTRVV